MSRFFGALCCLVALSSHSTFSHCFVERCPAGPLISMELPPGIGPFPKGQPGVDDGYKSTVPKPDTATPPKAVHRELKIFKPRALQIAPFPGTQPGVE
jgi:hypothetical protein